MPVTLAERAMGREQSWSSDQEPFECIFEPAYLSKITVVALTIVIIVAGKVNHPLWRGQDLASLFLDPVPQSMLTSFQEFSDLVLSLLFTR